MNRRSWLAAVVGVMAASVPLKLSARPRGPVYDARNWGPHDQRYLCFDAATEDEVKGVFFYDTNTNIVGRFRMDPEGRLFFHAADGHGLDGPDEIRETRPLRLVPIG